MHGVKHSWSGTAIVPRDNENNSHITESMCQRPTKLLLFSVQAQGHFMKELFSVH